MAIQSFHRSVVARKNAGGGGVWTPNSEASLVNWYDASVLGLSNGASVASFTDSKTGNPNPLTSTGGYNPTYATNQQNGLGAVNFVGGKVLETGGSGAHTFPYTIALVVKIPDVSAQYRFLSSEVGSTSGGIDLFSYTDGTIGLNKAGVAVIGQSSGTISTGAFHLVVVTVNATNVEFYIDGVGVGSGSGSFTMAGTGTFVLGGRTFNGGPNSAMIGYIGEAQIYNAVLDSTARGNLTTYIQGKWGI